MENLYVTFSRYPLRPHVEGCSHCVADGDHARIHSKPLRSLSGDDLGKFAFKALTTWGDQEDFRHFLPRILELVASGELPVSPEVAVGKLALANWQNWPQSERAAVEEYLSALWRFTLASFPAALEVDECLSSLAQVVDDLTPFLRLWREARTATALRHLAKFASLTCPDLAQHGYLGSFWRKRPVQQKQVIDWLLNPLTSEVLEQAFLKYPSESLQW